LSFGRIASRRKDKKGRKENESKQYGDSILLKMKEHGALSMENGGFII
jgi:phage pi2 protein 07